ncbi:MAG: KUP/HAK/KT family potassium transporter [Actinomycetales bacterium]|nr:KUP/HAK/KT family potassium transporter [Actinomycetales bacterium]
MRPPPPRGSALVAMTVGASGVVFGDIGTSPLYAYKESIAHNMASEAELFGIVSLIFWALMVVVSVKYLMVIMRADNHGEGGILSLLALLPKQIRQAPQGGQRWLFALILIGTALLFGDGVLTPAISVLSATEGLSQVNAGLGTYAVPLAVVILMALFAVQYRGTHAIGLVFGPVMLLWFVVIGGLGLWQALQDPGVFVALLPQYAIRFIVEHGFGSLALAGSVILAVTGAEALYADMGHFGARPIRLAWTVLVGPALVLCYLGQASLVRANPEAAVNPFFALAPKGWVLPLVLLAILATIIASQALITGVFSLARQGIQLGLLPRMSVQHTHAEHEGQIYVPTVNLIVGVLCVVCVLAFRTSSGLAHAYVLAIAGTMFITTIAFHAVATMVWHWPAYRRWPLTVTFLAVDLFFLIGTLGNLLRGGWVPVVFGAGVLTIMLVWWGGYRALNGYMASHEGRWSVIAEEIRRRRISRTPGLGVYLAAPVEDVPAALSTQARLLRSIPAEILIVSVVTDSTPFASKAPEIAKVINRVRRITIHAGYMESVDVPATLRAGILGAKEAEATYYVSERRFVATNAGELPAWRERLFAYLHRNSQAPISYFDLPPDRVIAIGTRVDL